MDEVTLAALRLVLFPVGWRLPDATPPASHTQTKNRTVPALDPGTLLSLGQTRSLHLPAPILPRIRCNSEPSCARFARFRFPFHYVDTTTVVLIIESVTQTPQNAQASPNEGLILKHRASGCWQVVPQSVSDSLGGPNRLISQNQPGPPQCLEFYL